LLPRKGFNPTRCPKSVSWSFFFLFLRFFFVSEPPADANSSAVLEEDVAVLVELEIEFEDALTEAKGNA
jgi:hypothetical protein